MSQGEFPEGCEVVKLVDHALRCTICYQLFDAPLCLRGCGHSFCSACIRQNLTFQERTGSPGCPSCRAPCDSRDLQPNVALRQIIERYKAARPTLLSLVMGAAEREAAAAAAAKDGAGGRGQGKRGELQAPPRRSGRRSREGAAKQAAAAAAATWQKGDTGDAQMSTRSSRQQQQQQQQQSQHGAAEEEEEEEERGGSRSAGRHTRRGSGGGPAAPAPAPAAADSDLDFCIEVDGSSDGSSSDDEFVASDASGDSPSPPAKKARHANGPHHPPLSQQRQHRQRARSTGRGDSAAPATQPQQPCSQRISDAPTGFVSCFICGKAVPDWYINSHLDKCLTADPPAAANDNAGSGGGGSGGGGTAPTQQQQQPTAAAVAPPRPADPERPFQPLPVPPKLVGILATEKSLRALLRQYGLPAEGKKDAMLERYGALRLAVETANDRQERTSYGKLAQRVAAAGRQRAAASLLVGAGPGGAPERPSSAAGDASGAVGRRAGGGGGSRGAAAAPVPPVGDGLALAGKSFPELIAATRRRDAARKASRAAAAAAAAAAGDGSPAEQHNQQQEEAQRPGMQGEVWSGYSAEEDEAPGLPQCPPDSVLLAAGATAGEAAHAAAAASREPSPHQRKEQRHPNPTLASVVGEAAQPSGTASIGPPGGCAAGFPGCTAAVAVPSRGGRGWEESVAAEVRAVRELMGDTDEDEEWR